MCAEEERTFSADLHRPFEGAIGPSSPVLKVIEIVRAIIDDTPIPKANSRESYFAAPLLALHTLHLIEGTGQLNGMGYHSAAVGLFRAIEDALDCFAAICIVPGAAEKWMMGHLKASDAAKSWTTTEGRRFRQISQAQPISLSDYRRRLRSQFDKFAHCSLAQTEWNLYVESDEASSRFRIRLNTVPMVVDKNAHRIDAHLTASLYEFVELIGIAFSEYLSANEQTREKLKALEPEILAILQQHVDHGCLNVTRAPEIAHLAWGT
jgi:hypothetical protein